MVLKDFFPIFYFLLFPVLFLSIMELNFSISFKAIPVCEQKFSLSFSVESSLSLGTYKPMPCNPGSLYGLYILIKTIGGPPCDWSEERWGIKCPPHEFNSWIWSSRTFFQSSIYYYYQFCFKYNVIKFLDFFQTIPLCKNNFLYFLFSWISIITRNLPANAM